jgi:hypothetical protein
MFTYKFMGIQANVTFYFIALMYIISRWNFTFLKCWINGCLKCTCGFSSFSHSNKNISSLYHKSRFEKKLPVNFKPTCYLLLLY